VGHDGINYIYYMRKIKHILVTEDLHRRIMVEKAVQGTTASKVIERAMDRAYGTDKKADRREPV